MSQIETIEHRLNKIEARNKSVETNKAWETSFTRKLLLAIFTYCAIAGYLHFVVGINPWINALVPTVGFLLSTLTLSYCKKLWEKYLYKNRL